MEGRRRWGGGEWERGKERGGGGGGGGAGGGAGEERGVKKFRPDHRLA